ncbi:rhodanese-like domain-containing protein [Streptococcus zalophi]|uniref:Rhodanese-like domain-containing protein n=1 Tax=Streptococcus zalophi TaxID=640031 RepID=A0A934P8R0_9STRE|nr:rhodanese-like domain-containing protein [Streptococcus zalophi]MBJ8349028.1 rhodanese-like domain-containing protein [Streptococcus zalophi]MCR8967821.1 rhodanese-like domain-containing protein [Streptococcus zalophi]
MIKSIPMSSFKDLHQQKSLNLIDVREKYEYESGHIPGAQNLPLSDLQFSFQTLDQEKEYYIICQSGSRSLMASQFLSAKGFHVTNIEGGTSAWQGTLE